MNVVQSFLFWTLFYSFFLIPYEKRSALKDRKRSAKPQGANGFRNNTYIASKDAVVWAESGGRSQATCPFKSS